MRSQKRNVEHNPEASHQDGGWELVTDVANEKDVGLDGLRVVCHIERVDLCRASTEASGKEMPQELRRASREMMHEGAVRVMAGGASGRALLVTRGTACGGVVMAPAGKTPKTKGGRR